ncbi:MAG: ABC transporter permease subunit [Oscillospiraceae bacterium]|nr:ABC transporter permease subunit [Oscillospiraceae bacterium]
MGKYMKVVFLKEMLDGFRDRRTIISSLLVPLVLYPMMFTFMDRGLSGMMEGVEERTIVAVAGSAAVYDILALNPGISVRESEDPLADLQNGNVTLALRGTETPDGKLEVEIIYDDKKNDSSRAAELVGRLVGQYGQMAVEQSLAALGIRLADLVPVTQRYTTISEATDETDGGSAGMMASMMVPMLVVVLLAVGGMAIASDLFAGEKERKTMEPLLCTRAGRSAILTGKLLAVTTFALLNVTASVAGMGIALMLAPGIFSMSDEMTGAASALNLPIPVILLTVGLVLLMALVFSGVHVVISTYARTSREAATYGSFIMIVSYVPVFALMFLGAGDIQRWMMFVPVMNVSGALKMVLGGITDYTFLLGSIGVSLLFVLGVMALARWMFTKETIMLRS